ncbi:ARM repeat-containing protein [Rhizopus microsporus]|uniref:ARM repeat-containing protein n=1 Tax=Rhizopus microsporus TaxID=58291 RepID=A0A1X0SED7_RHIZD|nr:ARM repeat-containing protein [Rhizopus microsporus]
MARLTYGNTNMPKFCMQSLVRITSNVDVAEAKKILLELLDYNIIELISICLRGDDVELIYWAAGLMHEFVIKDVVADKFRQIKGIHTILSGLLSAEEMYISRVILRTIKFMAAGQDKFLQDMVRSGMVKKIMHCLSLNDEDVKQWAILCIHVVAGQVESHQDIITAPEFEILLELATSSKMKVAIYVSDIISLICCITSNATYLEPHIKSLLKTLNTLLLEGESDVQYNAAGAIFNIMTTNTPFANKVRQINFKNILSVATTATNERVQMICTKGALMVVIKSKYTHI